jgi:hypothetical protein
VKRLSAKRAPRGVLLLSAEIMPSCTERPERRIGEVLEREQLGNLTGFVCRVGRSELDRAFSDRYQKRFARFIARALSNNTSSGRFATGDAE